MIFPAFARDPRSFIVLSWKNQSHFNFDFFQLLANCQSGTLLTLHFKQITEKGKRQEGGNEEMLNGLCRDFAGATCCTCFWTGLVRSVSCSSAVRQSERHTPFVSVCMHGCISECLKIVVIVFSLTLSVSQCHPFIFDCLCCRLQQIKERLKDPNGCRIWESVTSAIVVVLKASFSAVNV